MPKVHLFFFDFFDFLRALTFADNDRCSFRIAAGLHAVFNLDIRTQRIHARVFAWRGIRCITSVPSTPSVFKVVYSRAAPEAMPATPLDARRLQRRPRTVRFARLCRSSGRPIFEPVKMNPLAGSRFDRLFECYASIFKTGTGALLAAVFVSSSVVVRHALRVMCRSPSRKSSHCKP